MIRWAGLAVLTASLLGLGGRMPAQEVKKEEKKETKNDAVIPVPRDSKGWPERHQKFLERAKQGDVDVLFLGDSITAGWEGAGKEVWKKTFEPLKAANFGIGGDRTQHVLWRITEGKELEGIQPKVAVIMIGTNNSAQNTASEIADGVTVIVKTLRQARPKTKILLLAVFPRSDKSSKDLKDLDKVTTDQQRPRIKEINDIIAKLDDGKNIFFLDINKKFLDSNGSLPKKLMPDFLHLSPEGYEIWASAIEGKVKDLLK